MNTDKKSCIVIFILTLVPISYYSFSEYPFISGLTIGLILCLTAILIAFTDRFLTWINRDKFWQNHEQGVKFLQVDEYLYAYNCFCKAMEYKSHPITYFWCCWTLEKLGKVEDALWGYRSNCFSAHLKLRNRELTLQRFAFIVEEYGRAILRNEINSFKESEFHNPLEWIETALSYKEIRETTYYDSLRMTKGLIFYKTSKSHEERELAMKIFGQIITSAKDEDIKKFAINMHRSINFGEYISQYANSNGIENIPIGMQLISEIEKSAN